MFKAQQLQINPRDHFLLATTSLTYRQVRSVIGVLLVGLFFNYETIAQVVANDHIEIERPSIVESKKNIEVFQITGKVSNIENEPLIGVNITLLNSTMGTVSDLNGNFTLDIPKQIQQPALNLSYIGMEEVQVMIEKSTALNITMQVAENELPTIEVTAFAFMNRGCVFRCGVNVGTDCFKTPLSRALSPYDFENTDAHLENTAFPNPFTNQLNVKLQVPTAATYLLELYDVQGKLVFAEAKNLSNGQQAVALDQLPNHLLNGAYLLKVTHEDETHTMTQQVIKSNTY